MKKLAFVAVFAVGLFVGVSIRPVAQPIADRVEVAPVQDAWADKTVTFLSANPQWTEYCAHPSNTLPGGIAATICARAQFSDGGYAAPTCYGTEVGPGSSVTIDTLAVVNNRGLPFWKAAEGL